MSKFLIFPPTDPAAIFTVILFGNSLSSETIFTAIVGILLLKDPISIRFFIGAILVLGSGLILNWLKANEKK